MTAAGPCSDAGGLFTIGYEKRSLRDLVETLSGSGVDTVIDVRMNASSRKPGFSKTRLRGGLADAGIRYHHEPALGNPKDNRDPFRRGCTQARERYMGHLANNPTAVAALDRTVSSTSDRRVALLCYERDHDQCHRGCVADAARLQSPAITVTRL